MRRLLSLIILPLLLLAPVIGCAKPPATKDAVIEPFLWKIEGETPSYLFGTIHLPDKRVLELPEIVQRAFDGADAFYAEIPMDMGSMMQAQSSLNLPGGKKLKDVIDKDLYDRAVALTDRKLKDQPAMMRNMLKVTFERMQPVGMASQLATLDYLDDLAAGLEPLDLYLYNKARAAKKRVGGVETVKEQIAILTGMSMDLQVQMLTSAVEELEKAEKSGENSTERLMQAYLTGKLKELREEMEASMKGRPELEKYFQDRLIDHRNEVMAERIDAILKKDPSKSNFFALGAFHYEGKTAVDRLLTERGYKVRRLKMKDLNEVPMPKPAPVRDVAPAENEAPLATEPATSAP